MDVDMIEENPRPTKRPHLEDFMDIDPKTPEKSRAISVEPVEIPSVTQQSEIEPNQALVVQEIRSIEQQEGTRKRKPSRQKATVESDDESDDGLGAIGHSQSQRAAVSQQFSQHNYHYNAPTPPSSSDTRSATDKWFSTEVPYALLGYLQFFFNLSIVLLSLYLLVLFVTTILRDVEEKVSASTADLRAEIYSCAEAFAANKCNGFRDPSVRVPPALYGMCESWEVCMNRDPRQVGGKARLGAETIAEVVNGFVDVISWKTMIFLLTLAGLTIFLLNATISSYRHQIAPQIHQIHHAQPYAWPGPHPALQHTLSQDGLPALRNHEFAPSLPQLPAMPSGTSQKKKGWF